MDFNITVVGDPSTGKSTLIHRLLQLADDEQIKRPYYHFESNGKTYNIIETSGVAKKVNRLASKLLKTDIIIFLFSLVEEENVYMIEEDEEKPKRLYKSSLEALFELIGCLGLQKRIIYCLNKADHDLVEYSPDLIRRTKKELERQIRSYSIDSFTIPIVVASALKNENLVKNNNPDIDKSCIFDFLDQITESIVQERANSIVSRYMPLRFSVMCSHKVMGVGTIVQGNVISGSVKKNDEVIIYPSKKVAKVKSIQKYGVDVEAGKTNEVVALALKGISRHEVTKGVVIAHLNSTSDPDFNSAIVTLNVLFSFNGFYKDYKFNMLGYNLHVPVFIIKIIKKVTYDVEDLEEKADDLRAETGNVCTAQLRFEKPVFMENYRELGLMGRFVLVDNNVNVAYGTIDELITIK